MKNTRKQNIFVLTTLAAAMTGVFASMPAYADDEERAALTQPQNSVDAEVITVGTGSAQFGQYNGLNRKGAYGNANIQFRAGDAYTDNENGGTTRITVIGTDLGLSNRSASATYSDQGTWSAGVGYDALTHVIGTASGYQTPYGNGVGQNRFTLPSNFAPIYSASTDGGSRALSTTQLNDFGPQTIQTTRDNYSIFGTYNLSPSWTFSLDANHMVQSGAKLMAFAAAGGPAYPSGYAKTESVSVLPNPTNYQTDTLNALASWKGEDAFASLAYFGSFFRNAYDLSGVQFQPAFTVNAATGATGAGGVAGMQTMSTMPNNMMNQITLAAGYNLAAKTKLNGSLSYGLNTASPGAAYDSWMMSGPVASFNGQVTQTHGDIKLTDRTFDNLTLNALAKLDERNNQSSSNVDTQYYIGQIPPGVSGGAAVPLVNAPYSWRKGVVQLAADYKIDKNNTINATYTNEQMRRWCNNYASVSATAFPAGSSCIQGNNDSTNAIDLAYGLKASETVKFKLGAGYSMRKADINNNTSSVVFDGALPTATKNGSGDFYGFVPFYMASMNQAKIKGTATWQATDSLNFNLTGRLTNDTYPDNSLGVQNGYSWALSLDANYNWSETGLAYLFATQQQASRYTVSQQYSSATSNYQWNNTENNLTTSVGGGVKEKGLMAGKLTLGADGLLSFANTNYSTGLQPGAGTMTQASCSAATTMSCGNVPSIANNMYQLKGTASYQVDKHSKVGLAYMYQHLYSNDYYYNGYQQGFVPSSVMPTLQTSGSPSYSVNVVQARYTYDF